MLNKMLESNMPEEQKIDIRITLTIQRINEKIYKYAKPTQEDEKAKALYSARLELFNNIKQFEKDIDDFMSTHPLPAEMQD